MFDLRESRPQCQPLASSWSVAAAARRLCSQPSVSPGQASGTPTEEGSVQAVASIPRIGRVFGGGRTRPAASAVLTVSCRSETNWRILRGASGIWRIRDSLSSFFRQQNPRPGAENPSRRPSLGPAPRRRGAGKEQGRVFKQRPRPASQAVEARRAHSTRRLPGWPGRAGICHGGKCSSGQESVRGSWR